MDKYVLNFNEIDKADLPYVGGKGTNLGEMTKAGFPVPQGFCVTTKAYWNFLKTSVEMDELFNLLDQVSYDDLDEIRILGHRLREELGSLTMPDDIKTSILEALEKEGEGKAYAVRSSATAEDLPTASFAGQQDTYLNVCGREQILKAIQNCWASLFTDRAISYRAKNGFDHRSVFLSVVVQEMIFPDVSGIMFTADPISGHRKTISIDASFGLGEALVSGLVNADLYQIRSGEIIKKIFPRKRLRSMLCLKVERLQRISHLNIKNPRLCLMIKYLNWPNWVKKSKLTMVLSKTLNGVLLTENFIFFKAAPLPRYIQHHRF